MTQEQIRADFERDMPLPKGVYWNGQTNQYESDQPFTVANKTNARYQGYRFAHARYAGGGEAVAVADNGLINWIDGKKFKHEADLYTRPAPAVPDGLLDLLNAVGHHGSDFGQGEFQIGRDEVQKAQELYTMLTASKEGKHD